jgi:hypothetical protein
MSPDQAAKWVKYCNVEKKHKVRFWVIGHEPDLYDARNADPLVKHYDIYHYINDFRETYNAMKRADPSLFIMGPELAWKYSGVDEDWLTPFLRYNGDIVNMVSLHHYASLTPDLCTPRAVLDDLRRQTVLFRNLRSKVLENTDVLIPLVLTGGNTCAKPFASKDDDAAGPDSFWSVLWAADTMGLCLNERIGMGLFSLFAGEGSVSPAHWALRVFGRGMRGKVVTVQARDPNISAYALQDAKTRDVTLLLVNKGDRYQRLKISLNGGLSDLSVEAGLDQRYDLEIPYFSIASLGLKADRKPGEVLLYTRKMAREGKEPQVSVIKPW